MKILIVGSKGFIGSHCVDYFSKKHDVWECDVVLEYGNNRYIAIDAVDSDFQEIFRQQKFDVCINCSGAANVPFSLEKPFNDFRLNTLNVFKLLEAIRLFSPTCKFITMSSAAVYGNPASLPIKENAALAPVSPYGYHKVMAEKLCEEYHRFWQLSTCCLRIFSAYGPGLQKQLFWDIYHKFAHDESILLWGTGKETRDFIYIDDIVRAIELAIFHSDFNGEVVNVANGIQVSINEMAHTFLHLLQSDKEIRFNDMERKGDPHYWEADITRIKSWGYTQQIDLNEGIKNYILWIKELK